MAKNKEANATENIVINHGDMTIVARRKKTAARGMQPHWFTHRSGRILIGFWEGPKQEFTKKNMQDILHNFIVENFSNKEIERVVNDLLIMYHSEATEFQTTLWSNQMVIEFKINSLNELDFIDYSEYKDLEVMYRTAKISILGEAPQKRKDVTDHEKKRGRDPHWRSEPKMRQPDNISNANEEKREEMVEQAKKLKKNETIPIPVAQMPSKKKKNSNKKKEEKKKGIITDPDPIQLIKPEPEIVTLPHHEEVSTQTDTTPISTPESKEEEEVVVITSDPVETTKVIEPEVIKETTTPTKEIAVKQLPVLRETRNREISDACFHIGMNLYKVMPKQDAITFLEMVFGKCMETKIIEKIYNEGKPATNKASYNCPTTVMGFQARITRTIKARGGGQ